MAVGRFTGYEQIGSDIYRFKTADGRDLTLTGEAAGRLKEQLDAPPPTRIARDDGGRVYVSARPSFDELDRAGGFAAPDAAAGVRSVQDTRVAGAPHQPPPRETQGERFDRFDELGTGPQSAPVPPRSSAPAAFARSAAAAALDTAALPVTVPARAYRAAGGRGELVDDLADLSADEALQDATWLATGEEAADYRARVAAEREQFPNASAAGVALGTAAGGLGIEGLVERGGIGVARGVLKGPEGKELRTLRRESRSVPASGAKGRAREKARVVRADTQKSRVLGRLEELREQRTAEEPYELPTDADFDGIATSTEEQRSEALALAAEAQAHAAERKGALAAQRKARRAEIRALEKRQAKLAEDDPEADALAEKIEALEGFDDEDEASVVSEYADTARELSRSAKVMERAQELAAQAREAMARGDVRTAAKLSAKFDALDLMSAEESANGYRLMRARESDPAFAAELDDWQRAYDARFEERMKHIRGGAEPPPELTLDALNARRKELDRRYSVSREPIGFTVPEPEDYKRWKQAERRAGRLEQYAGRRFPGSGLDSAGSAVPQARATTRDEAEEKQVEYVRPEGWQP